MGHDGLLSTGDHHHQQIRRNGQVLQGPAVPGVPRPQMDLDEVDVALLLVVVEGLAHVTRLVDHGQPICHLRQQSALDGDRQQDNAEHQIEQIVFHLHTAQHRHNGEHDGGHAPQSGPGHHPHLAQRRAEGQQQQGSHQRTAHQSKEGHHSQGRQ